jgi:hypothetical protein
VVSCQLKEVRYEELSTMSELGSQAKFRCATAALAFGVAVALTLIAIASAQAQTFQVLHNFTDGYDGALPIGSPLVDASGNVYGTALNGGTDSVGTVWEITP